MTSLPTLSTDALSMSYGQRQVIHELGVSLPSGQVTAIVGPNGCGKSTLLSGLARLHKPDSGAVLLNGHDIAQMPARQLATKLALLPQEAVAPEGLTVTELIRFGRQPHQGWLRQWSAEDQQVVHHALAAAGLEALADRPLEALSGGQRQRAWIAMVLAQDSDILLMDEPVNHLDMAYQYTVLDLVRALTRDHGKTVVCVLHDLNLAAAFADEVVMLRDGTTIAAGPTIETVTPETVRQVFAFEADIFLRHDRLVCLPRPLGAKAPAP